MKKTTIDLAVYKEDHSFYEKIDLLLTIKSFDLQAIRTRYIQSRNNKSGKAGSVERRAIALGGIAEISVWSGQIEQQNILKKLNEPRAIDLREKSIAFSSENVVYVIDQGQLYTVRHPWFSYIHTISFHPDDESVILVASSGLDIIFEMNYKTNDVVFEWLAWENGFNLSRDAETGAPMFLTRSASQAQLWQETAIPHLLISNPANEALPTAKRAAFINSVSYDVNNPDQILATFFHEGKVYSIDKKTGIAEVVLSDLFNPHGGRNAPSNDYLATSTASGEILLGNSDHVKRFSFNNLPGKANGLGTMEWIQNTCMYNDWFIAIDSNRNALFIIDQANERYSKIPFDVDWAVQDLVVGQLPEQYSTMIRNLNLDE